MSEAAPLLLSTAALLAVAVFAGHVGALRERVRRLEEDHAKLRASHASNKAAIRRLDRDAVFDEDVDEDTPIGFRPP